MTTTEPPTGAATPADPSPGPGAAAGSGVPSDPGLAGRGPAGGDATGDVAGGDAAGPVGGGAAASGAAGGGGTARAVGADVAGAAGGAGGGSAGVGSAADGARGEGSTELRGAAAVRAGIAEAGGEVNARALRMARTPGDMAKAVLVLLIPLAVLVGFYVLFLGGNKPIAASVDDTFGEARAGGQFTVLTPENLPSGWTPVSADYSLSGKVGLLRIGYITPSGAGLQLIEGNAPSARLLHQELGDGDPIAKAVQIGDRSWGDVDSASHGNRALVETEAGRTVIIVGKAPTDEMTALAAALR